MTTEKAEPKLCPPDRHVLVRSHVIGNRHVVIRCILCEYRERVRVP